MIEVVFQVKVGNITESVITYTRIVATCASMCSATNDCARGFYKSLNCDPTSIHVLINTRVQETTAYKSSNV